MSPKNVRYVMLAIIIAVVLSISSWAVLLQNNEPTPAELFSEGMTEFGNSNYATASDLFWRSYQGYGSAGDGEKAAASLHWKFQSDRAIMEFSLTRAEAEAAVQELFPDLSIETVRYLLDDGSTERMVSDGQTWYYESIAMNIAFRNETLIHQLMERHGHTSVYDSLKSLVWSSQDENETYFNMTDFISVGGMTIPREDLPEQGTLKIWIPSPIDMASQTNISIQVSHPEYIVSNTSVDADLGLIYIEVPLTGMSEDIVINTTFTFSEYQMHFDVDPGMIGTYNTSSELYIKYTASKGNILITPEIEALANEIVGNETNPYLQAKLVYEHVIGNISYSYVPHISLCALGIPESEYVRMNMHGDCGAQSMYFSALLRSLGVPARTCGGYQSFPPGSGCHFWAEFYLPNYGWVPVDVTVAETADWSYDATEEEAREFKDFFFGNLDPYRMPLQNDVDLPLVPSSGDSVQFTTVYQYPAMVCEGSEIDLAIYVATVWSTSISKA